jgi:hypothetical protein
MIIFRELLTEEEVYERKQWLREMMAYPILPKLTKPSRLVDDILKMVENPLNDGSRRIYVTEFSCSEDAMLFKLSFELREI